MGDYACKYQLTRLVRAGYTLAMTLEQVGTVRGSRSVHKMAAPMYGVVSCPAAVLTSQL